MPLGSVIGAIGQVASGLPQMLRTDQMNKQSQKWSERMYQRQFDDNVNFWRMQNEYNTPEQQMQRYRDAGLNPNLAYGMGNSGNAGSISTPTPQRPEFNDRVPNTSDLGMNMINSMYDLEIKKAQTDNLKAQNTVILAEGALKKELLESTKVNTLRRQFDLDFEKESRPYSLEARKESARKLKVETDISINRDSRDAAMNASNLEDAVVRRGNMLVERARAKQSTQQSKAEEARIYQSIELLKKEGILRDYEAQLRGAGMNPNDPSWQLMVARFLDEFANSLGKKPSTGLLKWLIND